MNKRNIITALTGLMIVAFLLLSLLNKKIDPIKQTYFYLGTVIDITLYDTEDTKHLENISELIHSYDILLDRYNEKSDIYILNNQGSYEVDAQVLTIIKKGLSYSEFSDGYFDMTINPIVDLWGFGKLEQQVPDAAVLELALEKVDYKNIIIENDVVTLLNGASLDLGAIAKGFIADEIRNYLNENNIKKALINLGGNVYAHGNSVDEQPWVIGIRHPLENDAIISLELENKSVVTSGVTERFFEENGITYHHIFNPYTGFPLDNELLSMSVVSDKSIDGDALSTALYALGVEEAFNRVEDGIYLIAITRDQKIYISSELENNFTLYDESYEIIKK